MKSWCLHNITKKALRFFLPWRYGLSWSTTHPPCFPSRSITKNAETHPTPMRGVIIEQPHFCEYSYLKAANSFEESSIIDNWQSSKFAFRHFHSVLNFAVWQENYENRNKYLKFVVWFLNDYKFVIFFAIHVLFQTDFFINQIF